MSNTSPIVSSSKIQKRKLIEMSEIVPHFKEISGMKILIHTNVYSPGTDTHLMANTVRIRPGDDALDLGTGTGVIACKLALLGAGSVIGTDMNPRAIDNANENKKLLGLKNVNFRLRNVFEGVTKKFDVIVTNLPYTNKKPSNDIDICFYDEGHKVLHSFFAGLRSHLKPGGVAYIAWSNIGPMDLLPELAKKNNFSLELASEDVGSRGYKFYVYILKDNASPKIVKS